VASADGGEKNDKRKKRKPKTLLLSCSFFHYRFQVKNDDEVAEGKERRGRGEEESASSKLDLLLSYHCNPCITTMPGGRLEGEKRGGGRGRRSWVFLLM